MIHHTRVVDAVVRCWAPLTAELEVTVLPVQDAANLDGDRPLFARLNYDEALEVAARHGARLIAPAEVEILRKVGLQLMPYLGTPKAENAIEHSRRHDADVWRQLHALGWDGETPVAGAGKHWVDGAPPGKSRLMGWDKDGAGPGLAWWQHAAVAHNRQHFDDGTTTVLVRLRHARKEPPVPEPPPTTTIVTRTLREGLRGDDVRWLQTRVGATADGIFGPGTGRAVRAAQAARGLVADGLAGQRTVEALGGVWRPAPGAAAPAPAPTGAVGPDGLSCVTHWVPDGTGAPMREARWVVIHTAECGETPGAAAAVAGYLTTVGASAHFVVGDAQTIQQRSITQMAGAAPGSNEYGIQIELVGRASQTPEQWADTYSTAMLDRAAGLVAAICGRLSIPVVKLAPADLLAGSPGLTGHVDVSKAWRKSTHTDPGKDFPWPAFVELVRNKMGG